ncbi:peptidyl-tRNA hydrolase ICT1, mitochondrial-like [Camellia sinensis]|uniref:peptidyl-tRNA hydrolase ICT1, mitochondrial-like n=1 Tax=Camellia sinensis TaxID=4442 RepID=UPI00103575AC|nr:peptidyl-tRNA hydrolase ICT1, mitochondrial-like [Camellia sinensis]
MGAIRRATTNMILRDIFRPSLRSLSLSLGSARMFRTSLPSLSAPLRLMCRSIGSCPVRCAALDSGDGGKKAPARLSQIQQLMLDAEERAASAGNEPIPKIKLDHVTVNFARSGGPGGQNVNKVNTKVDMRFNVKTAYWLSERVRERIMQTEKNRINKDGELVISSTKTRTQKGNIEDALEKLQAIIDAASYVPPPPSEEQVKKIATMAAIGEKKRLQSKKALSEKKAFRRSRESWD